MKKGCKNIKEIDIFVRNSIVKLIIFFVILIVFIKRDIYCVFVFIVTSLMGYARFYCISDMLSVILHKNNRVSCCSIVNYFLIFFITIVFLKRYCLGRDEVCVLFSILGITIGSFGIIFGCISGELSKMSITRRR